MKSMKMIKVDKRCCATCKQKLNILKNWYLANDNFYCSESCRSNILEKLDISESIMY